VAISLLAWALAGADGWPVDAIVIAVIVVLNAVLGYVQEAQAEVSLAVAAVPEGLPVILSVVLTLGVQRMATHRPLSRTCPRWRRRALPR
jgi:P-type Ca2+ transporter type 2C